MNENKTVDVGGKPIFNVSFKKKDCTSKSDIKEICISANFMDKKGSIKPIHGVGNGPVTGRFTCDKSKEFKEAKIPYSRLHDTEGSMGSGEFVNIHCIFKNFEADPYDPASYSFTHTDKYLQCILNAGTKVFYRLGETIENNLDYIRSHTFAPKDPKKWAVICEHIVRHYNEGWSDGYYMNIEYWEIWNEPEGASETSPNWSETPLEYYELYRITANHLKSCFPNIKVGGFGCTGFYEIGTDERHAQNFLKGFFDYITAPATRAPIDFFSWHIYTTSVERMRFEIEESQRFLAGYNLEHIENIIDEWNYMKNWAPEEGLLRKSILGAAFVSAAHSVMQKSILSKSMYYDAEPDRISFCGLFNEYTRKNEKPFYSFVAFGKLYTLGTEVNITDDTDGIYTLAATDGKKHAIMLTNYEGADSSLKIELKNTGDTNTVSIYIIDENHDLNKISSVKTNGNISFVETVIKTNSIIFIELT